MKTKKIETINIRLSYVAAVSICLKTIESKAKEEYKEEARKQLFDFAKGLDELEKQGHITRK
jgi:hypothetical protein